MEEKNRKLDQTGNQISTIPSISSQSSIKTPLPQKIYSNSLSNLIMESQLKILAISALRVYPFVSELTNYLF